MDDNHRWIVAKPIAPLLAESGVTVSGVYEIFGLVERYLTVTRERTAPRRRGGYKFGMRIPQQYTANGERYSFYDLSKDGDRKWYEQFRQEKWG